MKTISSGTLGVGFAFFFYLYPVYLSVTAILALAKSSGYVHDWDVIPAKDPAANCRKLFVLKFISKEKRIDFFFPQIDLCVN